ncbi:MAG: hypothetical protein ACT4QD_21315 [Acidobacteriota bacterium]
MTHDDPRAAVTRDDPRAAMTRDAPQAAMTRDAPRAAVTGDDPRAAVTGDDPRDFGELDALVAQSVIVRVLDQASMRVQQAGHHSRVVTAGLRLVADFRHRPPVEQLRLGAVALMSFAAAHALLMLLLPPRAAPAWPWVTGLVVGAAGVALLVGADHWLVAWRSRRSRGSRRETI